MEKVVDFNDLNSDQQKEFEGLAEEYVNILHRINYFITNNNLDYDEIWDKANQEYDEDLSYADGE